MLPSVLFGLRAYVSSLLLPSAYEAGAPRTGSIRRWMTLAYIAAAYRTPDSVLLERIGLPPATDPNANLKTLAEPAELSAYAYTQRVIADIAPSVALINGALTSHAAGQEVELELLAFPANDTRGTFAC